MKELPIISVKEARKLLGKQSKDLDDGQITIIIRLLTETADVHLRKIYVKKSNNRLG